MKWFALALALLASPAPAAELGFYEGNGCAGAQKFPAVESWLARNVSIVSDSLPAGGPWLGIESDALWLASCWQRARPDAQLILAVPLVSNDAGQSLAVTAAGGNDAHFRDIAATLIAHGFGTARLRLGWEFNGGWFAWSAKGNIPAFIAAFRHAVAVFRAAPGGHFRIVWNPNAGYNQFPANEAWPGDDSVDDVALDFYDQAFPAQPNAAARWAFITSQVWGSNDAIEFAAAHAKPMLFAEWGVMARTPPFTANGGGDDPLFIKNMVALFRQFPAIAVASYFDFRGRCCDDRISPAQGTVFPKASAAFKAAFGE